jgi:hypothetical protein
MANSLDYVVAYKNLIDRVFGMQSVTEILRNKSPYQTSFENTNEKEVKIKTLAVQGLGAYTRLDGTGSGGYTKRTASVSWTTYKLEQERSGSYIIDAMDLAEAQTSILDFAKVLLESYVASEIDAYRFSKIFSLCSSDAEATLTNDTVIDAIDTGVYTLDEAKVPRNGRILFVSNAVYKLMKQSGEFFPTRNVQQNNGVINRDIVMFDDMPVVTVPQDRFYTAITLYDGVTNSNGVDQTGGHYVKTTSTGKDLNFMIVYAPSVCPCIKIMEPKIVDKAYNMDGNGYFYAYQMYHDLLIPTNQLPGDYIHNKAT